jgi:hypothetical protein
VQAQLGEQFVWQTRHGFVSDEVADRMGGVRVAIPGPDRWEAEWATRPLSTTDDAQGAE